MKDNKLSFVRVFGALALPALALASCDNNNNDGPNIDEPTGDGEGRFVLATSVAGSNSTDYVLVTAESLDSGVVTTVNNGTPNTGATQWVFLDNYLYGLTYNQGNAGTTSSFYLNDDGLIVARTKGYSISRFSSYGTYDNYILTMSTGNGPEKLADKNGYLPQTLLVTYIDVINQEATDNETATGLYSMENLLGNGEYVTLAGAEQVGSKLFCGAVPMGLSQYGYSDGDGKWLRGPEYKRLVHTEDGGSGAGSYSANTIVGTQYPDSCYVAIYSSDALVDPIIARTDKISSACGRYRSQYYQTVWAAENGDVYVFSASYAQTMTDPLQKTDLPAGVCRIPAGSTDFDDYYCDIQKQANGCSFMRCWPAGGNYFLLIMYDRPFSETGYAATELAIFDADAKKLTYVKNYPDNVTSIGKSTFVKDGYVYIALNVQDEYPAIYRIDPKTAEINKGVTVEATEITAFGYLDPVKE